MKHVQLINKIRLYEPNFDEELIQKAYIFSMRAHESQTRESGDPYFIHPLAVAGIVVDMKLDSATIATALLHDTVEDTLATINQIEDNFGKEIAQLVDGVTKLSQLKLGSVNEKSKEAENFRKLLLAMSNDLRVLLVKLADRLHNMRTLNFISNEKKRKRIATETMEIFAPLAGRIGMQEVKEELEDLAFSELNSKAHSSIIRRLGFLKEEYDNATSQIKNNLKKILNLESISSDIIGREKKPFSIWRKMQRKNISFENLSDVIAFRVIVNTIEDCYKALGKIHLNYSLVPDSFKDYISTPKQNGYKSIHTTVIESSGRRVEVQIRTKEMHEIAEFGLAAHWKYKDDSKNNNIAIDGIQYRWIRELLEILEHGGNPEEFLENTKLEMFQDQVFCFSPKGELYSLPTGSTPVDFAYAVHTQVGDTCVGAKVNGRITPLRSVLQNGDQVEIMISTAQTPSPIWLNFVATGKARSAIRRFKKDQQVSEYVDLGKAILDRAFSNSNLENNKKNIFRAKKIFQFKTEEELFASIGEGLISGKHVVEAINPQNFGQKSFVKSLAPSFVRNAINKVRHGQAKGGDHSIPIKGLIPGMAVHLATCCHPLVGDRIVGIQTPGRGITVHTIDCASLENFGSVPENWLDVSWDKTNDEINYLVGRIELTLTNEPGALHVVTGIVSSNLGNINNILIANRSEEFFDFRFDIQVRDVKHLTEIIAALRAEPMVHNVDRLRE